MQRSSLLGGLAALVLTACSDHQPHSVQPPEGPQLPANFIIKLTSNYEVRTSTTTIQFVHHQPVWGKFVYDVFDAPRMQEIWECFYDPTKRSWVYEDDTAPCILDQPTSKETIQKAINEGSYQPKPACPGPWYTCYEFL